MIVKNLVPGMKFGVPWGDEATYIAQVAPHPLYPDLRMVIWWMGDHWSHDALSPEQYVGEPMENPRSRLSGNLEDAFQAARMVLERDRRRGTIT
jgi:hypothetical protein